MFDSLTSQSNPSTIVRILGIVIPALLILVLLMKAAKYAKKGSGQFGEMVIKGTEIAMGATAGLALGGAAVVGQATIGQASSRLANSEWAKRREAEGRIGGALFRRTTQGLASSSFDARKGIVGAGLAVVGGVSGLNLGHKTKYFMKGEGGFEADKKRKIENRQKRAKDLEVGEDEGLKQTARTAENELATLKNDKTRQDALVKLNGGDSTAPAGSVASKGVGGLEKELTTKERELADAERTLRDAMNQLTTSNNNLNTAKLVQSGAEATKNQADIALAGNPTDTTLQAAQVAAAAALTKANNDLTTAQGDLSVAEGVKNTAETARTAAITAKETARVDLATRKDDISAQEKPIKAAEDALKLAQNAVTAENRIRKVGGVDSITGEMRRGYADVVQTSFFPSLDFLNAGGRWTGGGAQREAANRIRAGVEAEKK